MIFLITLFQASQLLKSLEIQEIEEKETVMEELEAQIKLAQEATKGNHKTMKVLYGSQYVKTLLQGLTEQDSSKETGLQIFSYDWWAEVTHGAKNGGSFSEMMGPSIFN